MDCLRVGVVGTGRIAQAAHLPHLLRHRNLFDVVGVTDVDRDFAVSVGQRFSVPVAADVEQLLHAGLDAVIVATPWPTHAALVCRALEAGVSVLCEKPLTLTAAELDAVEEAEARSAGIVHVAYMRRFDAAVRELLDEVRGGIDELRFVAVDVHDPDSPDQVARFGVTRAAPTEAARLAYEEAALRATAEAGNDVTPGAVRAYTRTYSSSLVHDVNLVHAVLDRIGASAVQAVGGTWSADGASASLVGRIGQTALLHAVHANTPLLPGYRSRHTYCWQDRLVEVEFPDPYLPYRSAVVTTTRPGHSGSVEVLRSAHDGVDKFEQQLLAFRLAVLDGGSAPVGVDEARRDQTFLRQVFALACAAANRAPAQESAPAI